jgi:NAD+ synthase
MACENTLGVILPCDSNWYLSPDREHVLLAASHFGIKHIEIDLTKTKSSMTEAISDDLTRQAEMNIAPRLRMTALYAIAANCGSLVVGTSNRSEIYLGYFTKWGDGAADLNPIADLTATEVLEFLEFLKTPEIFYTKAPSAGLYEGQTDEAELGFSYDELDRYLLYGEIGANFAKIQNFHANSEHKRQNILKFEGR